MKVVDVSLNSLIDLANSTDLCPQVTITNVRKRMAKGEGFRLASMPSFRLERQVSRAKSIIKQDPSQMFSLSTFFLLLS